jgi:hypothetical protein
MKNNFTYVMLFSLAIAAIPAKAQLHVKVVAGMISLDDGTYSPNQKQYASFIDSLDLNLKAHPNDTTSLFYRALLYLQYNSFIINPDLSTNQATNKLLLARKMVDRADSLKMQSFYLKVLRAQLCRELTTRYAPIEIWQFNNKQMADRKKKYDYFKSLANRYYDELAILDKRNTYDYQKLKLAANNP